jgi:hypothetical protein
MNYRNNIVFVFIFFIVIACARKETAIVPKEPTFPVLIDSLVASADSLTLRRMVLSNYKPITFKRNQDTIYVNHSIRQNLSFGMSESNYLEYMHYHRTNIMADNVSKADSTNLSIFVDTTKVISKIDYDREKRIPFACKSYPTYIINTSVKDTVILGTNSNIDALLEAKNSENKWQRIEGIRFIACATGRTLFVLPEKDTIITAVAIHKGTFKTKLRMRLGTAYSNEFEGYLNTRQFILSDDDLYERF